MGASIVYGLMSTDGNGFRLGLEELLEANGTQTTMVGTQWSGNMTDNHHEAYQGAMIDEYNNKSYHSGAYEMGANVFLIHIGTNDCWWVKGENGTRAAEHLGYLLDSIHAKAPDALVLPSTLIRSTQEKQDQCLQGLNSHLPKVVEAAVAKGQHARLVDMYDVVPWNEMNEDGTHPTDAGYLLMSRQWYDAIVNATADFCVNAPPEAAVNTTSSEPSSTSSVQDAASTQSANSSTTAASGAEKLLGFGLLAVFVPAAMWVLGV